MTQEDVGLGQEKQACSLVHLTKVATADQALEMLDPMELPCTFNNITPTHTIPFTRDAWAIVPDWKYASTCQTGPEKIALEMQGWAAPCSDTYCGSVHGPIHDLGSTGLHGLLILLCIFAWRHRNSSFFKQNFLWWPKLYQQIYFVVTLFRWLYNSLSGCLWHGFSPQAALLGGEQGGAVVFFSHLLWW